MSCSCKFFLCCSTFTTQAAASDYRKLAGIYVLPSTDSLFTWHGVIFVRCALLAHGLSCARRCSSHQFRCLVLRSGLYREGVFKFVIRFPDNFPKACPSVQFFSSVNDLADQQCLFLTPFSNLHSLAHGLNFINTWSALWSRVFHPLIRPNGNAEVHRYFPDWNPKTDKVVHVLLVIKKIFKTMHTRAEPCNREAANLLKTNEDAFRAAVHDCVRESIENIYRNPDNSSLKFTEYKPHHQDLRQALSAAVQEDKVGDSSAAKDLPSEAK